MTFANMDASFKYIWLDSLDSSNASFSIGAVSCCVGATTGALPKLIGYLGICICSMAIVVWKVWLSEQ